MTKYENAKMNKCENSSPLHGGNEGGLYPLYDVPWLVRDPNAYRMSEKRHQIEVRNQAVVDDYFVARDMGVPAIEAQRQTAEKHQLTTKQVYNIIKWFFHEAKKRKKYDFLIKFAPLEEH